MRRGYLFAWDDDDSAHTSLSLQLALRHLDAKGIRLGPTDAHPDWVAIGETGIPPREMDFGAYTRLDAGGYQFMLDYARGADAFARLDASGADDALVSLCKHCLDRIDDGVGNRGVTAASLDAHRPIVHRGEQRARP